VECGLESRRVAGVICEGMSGNEIMEPGRASWLWSCTGRAVHQYKCNALARELFCTGVQSPFLKFRCLGGNSRVPVRNAAIVFHPCTATRRARTAHHTRPRPTPSFPKPKKKRHHVLIAARFSALGAGNEPHQPPNPQPVYVSRHAKRSTSRPGVHVSRALTGKPVRHGPGLRMGAETERKFWSRPAPSRPGSKVLHVLLCSTPPVPKIMWSRHYCVLPLFVNNFLNYV
jgi:hypothetical protein